MLLVTDSIDINPVDYVTWTPLVWAIIKGHKEIAEALFSMDGIDPSLVDTKWGLVLLLWAELKGYEEIVRLLLMRGVVNPVPVARFGSD
jgi:ankyrin repeat protein